MQRRSSKRRIQETVDRRQENGKGRKNGMVEECRKKTEYRSQKTGVRIQKTGDRSLNGGSRILDSGFWMLPKPRRGKDRMVKVMVSGLDM